MNAIDAVSTFCRVARPIMLEYMSRASCIASTRIAIEVLKPYLRGLQPRACILRVDCPQLEKTFVSGPRERLDFSKARDVTRMQVETEPYEGHVVAVHERGLIDGSIDQALWAVGFSEPPEVLHVAPVQLSRNFDVSVKALVDHPPRQQIEIRYISLEDMSFLEAPAWELDWLQDPIKIIQAAMRAKVHKHPSSRALVRESSEASA